MSNAQLPIRTLLAFIFILLCSNGFAQEAKIKFGLHLDGTLSKFAITSESPNSQYKGPYSLAPAFSVGAIANLSVLKTWSVSTGLKMIGKAIQVKGEPIDRFQDQGYKDFFYLELPITVLKDFRIGKVNLFAGAGGYVSHLISGNEFQAWEAYSYGPSSSSTEFYLFNKRDAGLIFTAGFRSSKRMSFVAGYELGMKNVINNPIDFALEKTQLKNRTLTLGIIGQL